MTETLIAKDDEALLRELRATGDRGVLEELVRRHVDFVYSAARRQVGGDAHLAEDVTQGVFVLLGRKRPVVGEGKLAGWLFNTTRFVARNAVKMEMRRRKHERAAAGMRGEVAGRQDEARWEDVGPVLDGAVAQLGRGERDVVLMHYFQNMTLGEVARRLGISEVAARQRSSRAVGKLREMLAKQGVACSAVGLAEGMRKYAVGKAPEGMVVKAGAATGGGVAVATSAASAMTALKVKVAAAVVGAAVVVGGGVVMVERQLNGGVRPANGAAAAGLPPAADVSNFKTFHARLTVRPADGMPVRVQEVLIDTQKGVLGLRHAGNDTYVETSDGTGTYRFKEGGDLVVKAGRSELNMAEARRIAGEFGSWRTAGPVREPGSDVTVNGERWQAYGVSRWRMMDGNPGTVWVDGNGVLRRARAKGGPNDELREFDVEFDKTLPAKVPAELPKGARVVGEAQLLEELYPVKGALAVAEAASHVVAVHSATRDADGRYHLVMSVRPNAAAQKVAGTSPPANYVVRPDGDHVGSAVVVSRQDIAGVSVRDVVIVPGGKTRDGVCEFDVTVLPWGEITGALQEQGLPISGMAHLAVRVDGRGGSLEDVLRGTYDRVAKLSGPVTGGVSLETRGTMPVVVPPGQVGRDVFVGTVAKRLKGK